MSPMQASEVFEAKMQLLQGPSGGHSQLQNRFPKAPTCRAVCFQTLHRRSRDPVWPVAIVGGDCNGLGGNRQSPCGPLG